MADPRNHQHNPRYANYGAPATAATAPQGTPAAATVRTQRLDAARERGTVQGPVNRLKVPNG